MPNECIRRGLTHLNPDFLPTIVTGVLNSHSCQLWRKDAIINSYDNSIRYSDFIIDSALSIINVHAEISAGMYVSDHGEDLFDRNPTAIDFHARPSEHTLHVPLFLWTSEKYESMFPSKKKNLIENRSRKLGTENIFYSVADLGNVHFPSFDFTKSIFDSTFSDSPQLYYNDDQRAVPFSQFEIFPVASR
ncbi:MAG TPA: sulfatase-like hydrolase/transferase [Chryseosolibacter sp.]|nr:sulfatase-like hydrolase/transferase [Chryseosolibacter sp.]